MLLLENTVVPRKAQIKHIYEQYGTVFSEILSNIEKKLKETISITSKPTYKARIKSFNSYYKKILRQKPKEAAMGETLVTLTDMMGIRVICAFLEDLTIVEKQLMEAFDVKEVERKGAEQSFREFGYESVHILVALPKDCIPQNLALPLPEDIVCEIQIRTILQDAWAEVEHELIYKSEFNPFDKPLRRKLASINASLSLADTIFQEIRDYQNKLQSELGYRRGTFYNKADEITEGELGVTHSPLLEPANPPPPANSAQEVATSSYENIYSASSIDDLVLLALHEHNQGNFSEAVSIYTKILSTTPSLPDVAKAVIFKHRGMAYFAQNEYDKALCDFKSSEKCDAKGFRAIYYEGIVYSVQNREREAIDCFERSLAIDSYQSHVYYRRALAYYNLGEYTRSIEDVNAAINLGLVDNDVKALKAKLMEKFDMKV